MLSTLSTFSTLSKKMKTLLLAAAFSAALAARAERPTLDVPRAKTAPVIDGDLSDACWRDAAVITRLRPAMGATSDADTNPQETTVRVLWSDSHLFVAFDCVDADVFTTGALGHDDNLYTEDVVEIFIDGVGDGRQYIEIQIAPDGANLDLMYVYTSAITNAPDGRVAESILRRDRWGFREWEMEGLQTAARRAGRGWFAEAALPAKDIVRRLGETQFKPGMEPRVQFARYDHVPAGEDPGTRRIIQQTWNPVVHGNPHNSPGLFGVLKLGAE